MEPLGAWLSDTSKGFLGRSLGLGGAGQRQEGAYRTQVVVGRVEVVDKYEAGIWNQSQVQHGQIPMPLR